jgi:hypothetical protein
MFSHVLSFMKTLPFIKAQIFYPLSAHGLLDISLVNIELPLQQRLAIEEYGLRYDV